MTDSVISLRGVGKRYIKYVDRPTLFRSKGRRERTRTTKSDLWAVHDVNLEIGAGESLGILGRNGAGKSTMLQMLAGVTAPSTGTVHVDGRVSPLISVGVGFHPELTGRENVYLNGTILGMSRQTIDRRFDAIVGFAELERFIDTPVKFYSSGMFVRLGFSVAIEADPDVLLVDEILAVGDFAFQLKCYDRMQDIRNSGTTVVVVSHNLGALRTFCDRGLVMERGRVIHDGSMFDAIGVYHELMAVTEVEGDDPDETWEPATLEVLDARFCLPDGSPAAHVDAGEEVVYRATVRALRDVDQPYADLVIGADDRDICIYRESNAASAYPALRAGETATYEVRFRAAFPTGSYAASLNLYRLVDDRKRIRIGRGPKVSFYTSGRPMVGGIADLKASFQAGLAS